MLFQGLAGHELKEINACITDVRRSTRKKGSMVEGYNMTGLESSR